MEKSKSKAIKDSPQEVLYIETTHKIYFQDAINIRKIKDKSVHLVVTSPPYWKIKDYGNSSQIGYNDSLDGYFKKLNRIWEECIRVLHSGCKLCINIGDQFLRAIKNKRVYQIIPLHSYLVNEILREFGDKVVYLGSINWNKVSTSNTSGGGHIMGSIFYPRNGYFFINREYIAIFRKYGRDPRPDPELKKRSYIPIEKWREFFKDTWNFPGINQQEHDAMYPEELPRRLIKMYSFVGDIVLDPFLGSGTTSKVASDLGRSSIGYEIGYNHENWKILIKQKIESGIKNYPAKFNYY
ncbi:MAG: DNA-methyltransferase [Candidatus Thorarchaeota archaeon]